MGLKGATLFYTMNDEFVFIIYLTILYFRLFIFVENAIVIKNFFESFIGILLVFTLISEFLNVG